MTDNPMEQMYPDVLGAISGGLRVDMDVLQCAPGIFPSQAYVNQPVEMVLLVQNMIDLPVQVTVTLHLPNQDSNGRPLMIDTPASVMNQIMVGGEAGVFRLPMVVHPPSQPGAGVPIGVQVQFRTGRTGLLGSPMTTATHVRPPNGAPPPASLAVSIYKLQALREVLFMVPQWEDQTDIMTVTFDIAPKRMPPMRDPLSPRYETLWTPGDLQNEAEILEVHLPVARSIAAGLTSGILYTTMLEAIEERFRGRGMPLEPGETKAIAKLLTYTLSDVSTEQNFDLEKTLWFQTLVRALAYDDRARSWPPEVIVSRYLFDAAIYDAIMLAFKIIQPRVHERLGTAMERRDYARNVVAWLGSRAEPNIGYVYLPLILGGLALNLSVGVTLENPWIMIDQLGEAAEMRMRFAREETQTVFDMLNVLLNRAEDELVRAHITR